MASTTGRGLGGVRRFVLGPLRSNCYLVYSEGEAAIIDPGWHEGLEPLLGIVGKMGLRVNAIIATHGHFDHVSGVTVIKRVLSAPFMIHGGDLELAMTAHRFAYTLTGVEPPQVPEPDTILGEGDAVEVGSLRLRVLEVPGHTGGSIAIYIDRDPSLGVERPVLFAGDTLFRGSIGRVDLPGSAPEKMASSLRRLASLPRDTIVYPGHGPETSIGVEVDSNQYLKAILGV